jgi:cellulose synthase/poly-beta-1,6-N-acetylglucosamine synthase-like glycosyltransferase
VSPLHWVPTSLLGLSVLIAAYAFVFYPILLLIGVAVRGRSRVTQQPTAWPEITIAVPVHNEERHIAGKIENLLAIEYPSNKRHILVVSDASTDGTDEIVRRYSHMGVQLVRQPERRGKTAAENLARAHVRGSIVITTDASTRIDAGVIKHLVQAFENPEIGVASSNNISVSTRASDVVRAESWYTRYDMWVRDLESQLGGIVGASGALFACTSAVFDELLPEALSRDFAAPLVAREQGLKSVLVREAHCSVPRSVSLGREYRRKVRTMSRGLETLFFKRHLLNPFRYRMFAIQLASHKLIRWLVPWAMVAIAISIASLALTGVPWARWASLGLGLSVAAGLVGLFWARRGTPPALLSAAAYLVAGVVAGIHAWVNALRGELSPTWEPTRR